MKNLKFLFIAASLMLAGTVQASSNIEVVAELSGTRPGNPTVTPAGRILFFPNNHWTDQNFE